MKSVWDKKWAEVMASAPTGSTATSAETKKEEAPKKEPNYLMPDGEAPKNDLLPGIGGDPLPKEEEEQGTGDAAMAEAMEKLNDLIGSLSAPAAAENAAAAAASDRLAMANEVRQDAVAKGDALYDALLAFAGKQDGRYDSLISQISEKGYADFAGVEDLLAYYEKQGDRTYRNTAAEHAIDNGGNPDSYAAAQAARGRMDFTDAGMEAALAYYNDQLDNWLSAIRAAGDDGAAIYGLAQDNVDSLHGAATDEGELGDSLFSSLADLTEARQDAAVEAYSSLLSHYKNSAGKSESAPTQEESKEEETATVSPMEIDREYAYLIGSLPGGSPRYTKTEALILLWKKYPAMQNYLLEKYDEILNTPYQFNK